MFSVESNKLKCIVMFAISLENVKTTVSYILKKH